MFYEQQKAPVSHAGAFWDFFETYNASSWRAV
jgi:hypothetical protein